MILHPRSSTRQTLPYPHTSDGRLPSHLLFPQRFLGMPITPQSTRAPYHHRHQRYQFRYRHYPIFVRKRSRYPLPTEDRSEDHPHAAPHFILQILSQKSRRSLSLAVTQASDCPLHKVRISASTIATTMSLRFNRGNHSWKL